MSRLNLSENLFIGVQELKTFQDFNSNFLNILGLLTNTYGFIENKDAIRLSDIADTDKTCFKTSSPGNLQIQFNTPSYAFSYPNNFLYYQWKFH